MQTSWYRNALLLFLATAFAPQIAGASPQPRLALERIDMVDQQHGWAVAQNGGDYAVMRTSDAGRHWKDVSPSGFSPAEHGATLYADEQGIDLATVGGKDVWVARVYGAQDAIQMFVWYSADSGRHWSVSKQAAPDVFGVYLQFVDMRHGFILTTSDAGMGSEAKRVYRTSNGGKAWQLVSDGFPGRVTTGSMPLGDFPTGITFRDAQNGWVGMSSTGETGIGLYHTKDAGRTWVQQAVQVPTNYVGGNYDCYSLAPTFFRGGPRGALPMALFGGSEAAFAVATTQDSGATWQQARIVYSGESSSILEGGSLSFTGDGYGWVPVSGTKSFYRTQDGGRKWTIEKTDRILSSNAPDTEVEAQLDFVSSEVGWALLKHGGFGNNSVELLLTKDGGSHWQRVSFWPGTTGKILPLAEHKKAGK